MKRVCKICKKERHTTSILLPYVCEPCLRGKGRVLLLNYRNILEKSKEEGKKGGSELLSFFLGIVIGIILVKILDLFF